MGFVSWSIGEDLVEEIDDIWVKVMEKVSVAGCIQEQGSVLRSKTTR